MELRRFKMNSLTKKIIIAAAVCLVVVIAALNSCSIVKEGQRGVAYTFGKLSSGVIAPGIKIHAPFVTKVKKFSIVPRTTSIVFSYGSDAAVTSDMQSVGCEINVIYRYLESGIIKIATEYSDDILRDNVTRLTKSSIKAVIGKYSIYDLTSKQIAISDEAKAELTKQVENSNYPVVVDNVVVTNWDWSQEFDRKIQDRMNATEAVLKAERELKLTETNAQKIVKEAEAKKAAEEKNAEAMLVKAKAEAEARKLLADADAYEAQQIKENQESYQKQWEHEEKMKEFEKWDGRKVPSAAYVVPSTGVVVPLK